MTHRLTPPTTLTALTSVAAGLAFVGLTASPVVATSDPSAGQTDFARAVAAALAETGEGVVTSFEVERTGYDVEVRLGDGSDVDVDLDDEFAIVRVRPDTEQDGDADRVSESADLARAYEAVAAHISAGDLEGGAIVSIELDDDGGYDAEVTLGGTEMEVHLDGGFDVIRIERDDD